MNVPLLKVMSFIALRVIEAESGENRVKGQNKSRMPGKVRAQADAMESRGLSEQAVELPHLTHARFGPAVSRDNGLYFFTKRLEVLRSGSEVVQYMCHALAGRNVSYIHKAATEAGYAP